MTRSPPPTEGPPVVTRIPPAAVQAALQAAGQVLAGWARRIGTAVRARLAGRTGVVRLDRRAFAPAVLVLVAVTIGAFAITTAASAPTHAASTADAAERSAAAARADRSARTRPADRKAAANKGAVKPAAKPARKRPPAWVAPMTRFTLSSCYGRRWGAMHQGLDFAMPAGT